jgi:hypothetical protein
MNNNEKNLVEIIEISRPAELGEAQRNDIMIDIGRLAVISSALDSRLKERRPKLVRRIAKNLLHPLKSSNDRYWAERYKNDKRMVENNISNAISVLSGEITPEYYEEYANLTMPPVVIEDAFSSGQRQAKLYELAAAEDHGLSGS